MAGSYVDAPGPKIFYDADGSAGFTLSGNGTGVGTPAAATAQNLIDGNKEAFGAWVWPHGGLNTDRTTGLIFPHLMDILGYFIVTSASNRPATNLQTSTNTTNGSDGTWTTRASGTLPSWTTAVSPQYRTPQVVSYTGINGIRWGVQCSSGCTGEAVGVAHFYGRPSGAAAPDRLRIWHPTLDQEMTAAGLDYGDFGRGGTIDRQFRVKNNSSSLTAQSIVLSRDALSDPTPSVVAMQTISQGGAFDVTQNIGNLAPGAISGICTLRIASPTNAPLGPYRQRLIATAGSWV